MSNREIFPNPPIVEAIIDIAVDLPDGTTIDNLADFQTNVKEAFPKRQSRIAWKGKIELQEGSEPKVFAPSGTPDGFMFSSDDGKTFVQARLDGFSYSKLKPYSRWEEFSDEAKKLWYQYIAVTKPQSIKKLSLRYINRIEIPLPLNDFKDYILTMPDIAPGVPSAVSELFLRLVIPDPKSKAKAILIETIDINDNISDMIPFIFDIEVIHELEQSNQEDMWKFFEYMHEFKNTIFFNSITEKARGLFE